MAVSAKDLINNRKLIEERKDDQIEIEGAVAKVLT